MTIKELIKYRELRQIEVSKAARIHHSTLCNFLNGWVRLTPDHLQRLADVLNVTPKELLLNQVNPGREDEK